MNRKNRFYISDRKHFKNHIVLQKNALKINKLIDITSCSCCKKLGHSGQKTIMTTKMSSFDVEWSI